MALSIMQQVRFSYMPRTAGRFQVATALGEHVLHPLRFGAIGQRDDEMVITLEDKNRCAVQPMGFPSCMYNDSHSWKILCEGTENPICHMQIQSCQPSRCGHSNSPALLSSVFIYQPVLLPLQHSQFCCREKARLSARQDANVECCRKGKPHRRP